MAKKRTILGQPSWELSNDTVQLAVTCRGGQMAPVRFNLGSQIIDPFSVAPWAEERTDAQTPAILRALRGDFFCAPFGGNETPFHGESHPPHGETANEPWKLEFLAANGSRPTLHLSMETRIRPGRVDKFIQLREGESVVYCRHVLDGMSGKMSFGHHAMLNFPDRERCGHLSTSRISFAQVAPLTFERPAQRGYQSLLPGAVFKRLDRVPSLFGGHADLSRYPARRGYEDLVMLIHASRMDFAWSAVVFPHERYVWFALKDPRALRGTILWISNGGRHYPPWNGRHTNVMGIEDVTSYFHYGLAESARENPLNRLGHVTAVELEKTKPLAVNYIMGLAAVPPGFEKVKSIVPATGEIVITSREGHRIKVTADTTFLKNAPL